MSYVAPTVGTSKWVLYQSCVTGPGSNAHTPALRWGMAPGVPCPDAVGDNIIDLTEFAAPQRVFGAIA